MQEILKKIKHFIINSKNMQNSFWIIGEQVIQMLISLVVGVLSARYLGPENYGTLSYTASFVTFALSVAKLGMDAVVVKKLVDHPENEGEYIGTSMLYRIISAIVSIVAITVIVYLLNPGDTIKLVLALLQSFRLIFVAIQILDSWFQRKLKSKYVSIGKMVAYIVVSAYKIYLLATAKSVVWFAFSNTLSDIIIAILLLVFYKRQNGARFKIDYKIGNGVLKESYHFIISGIMTAIYSQMDKIMIGQMLTDTDVGFYTTASTICSMWIFVPLAIINSFRPMIFELKQKGDEQIYMQRLKQLYSAIIWLCIFVSAVISLFSNFIICTLYGEAYRGAVGTLQIVIWCEVFSMIGSARGIWVLCEKKNKYVKYYLAIGAAVNLILNRVLIPLWGIEGAAFATLITQIVASMIAPLFYKETRIHTKYVLEAFALTCWFKKQK